MAPEKHVIGGQNQERGKTDSKDFSHDLSTVLAETDADGNLFGKSQKGQGKAAGKKLGDDRGHGGSGDSHIQAEDEHRIQDNVADRSDEHRGHTDDREALTVDEVVEPDGHEGKKVPMV